LTSVLTVVFFDIGQGDSILVSLPTGERILIDAAESNKVGAVTSYLRESGIDTIDYLVATHPHADHIGGMASVIVSFAVKSVWMPDATTTTKTFENLLDAIEARGLEIDIAGAGAVLFDYGTIKAEFVAPVGSGYKDLNDYSAVLKLTYGERVFLFMGDAETVSENEIVSSGADIAADVLKVGHHGSNSSSSRAFVQKVNPTYAVISSGAGNSYGHPAAKTLSTFADLGVTVLRTDINGMVVFHTDGQYLDYTTERSQVGTPPR
jgi:competence protein ComEC